MRLLEAIGDGSFGLEETVFEDSEADFVYNPKLPENYNPNLPIKSPAYQAQQYVEELMVRKVNAILDPESICLELRARRERIRTEEGIPLNRAQLVWEDHFGICVEKILYENWGFMPESGSGIDDSRLVPIGTPSSDPSFEDLAF